MTLILALVVPFVCSYYISPVIDDMVGDNTFLSLSSSAIANLLMWLVLIGFMVMLGGTMILRLCGVFGILGLIFAYWLLGNVYDAVIPICMLILSLIITTLLKKRKEDKKKASKSRNLFAPNPLSPSSPR